MVSLIFDIEAELPNISLVLVLLTFCFKTLVSVTKLPLSKAFLTVINKRFKSGGLEIKSKAPFLEASTAVSTVPWPEIMINGKSGFSSNPADSTSIPSILFILMSQRTKS